MPIKNSIELFFDGCCEPVNPGGTSSYGLIIFQDSKKIYEKSEIVAKGKSSTNNVAEYAGILEGLRWLYRHKLYKENILCRGDSKLVIEQLMGRWKINQGVYVPWALKCKKALVYFPNIALQWIPRDENYLADALSKAVLKKAGINFRIQPEG